MRLLGLLRHAKSDYPTGTVDHDRPLSRRGRRDAASVGDVVRAQLGPPDLVIVSTALRAQQTWQLAASAWSDPPEHSDDSRIYEASVAALLEVVHAVDPNVQSLLLVGHNPGFESLALRLAGEASGAKALRRLRDKYPTCALAVFEVGEWSDVGRGDAVLCSFDTPR